MHLDPPETMNQMDSSSNRIINKVFIKVAMIQQPSWSQIYRGERVTLRCEIQGGGGAQWTYEWRPTNRNSPSSSEYRIISATEAQSGEYSCRGRTERFSLTPWSDVIKITLRKL
ncbi:hypothetical protein ATANTOWER_021091 [Ataeniobius toweri]|uniref:Ig-like domain-containing protein n=1 Tax=Ataeniobius toweri TaxID=208326 RepID=A0ABU7BJX7_9TELE|nr:hypothetical protein [Ataeniobius toweri]